MKVVALAGGVGGAKFSEGLQDCLRSEKLCVIVNTGDDFWHWGLRICPDLDTVCYTLAGMENSQTGWGRAEETFNVLENIGNLGGSAWFKIGDKDLGTHFERTRLLLSGMPLSRIVSRFANKWGIEATVLPMTDEQVSTLVLLQDGGELEFQEYFVKNRCEPAVRGFRFRGIEEAVPAPGVLDFLSDSDLVIICPSNPWVSIRPIIDLVGISDILMWKKVIGISPLIGGKTVKGPAAKMFSELGFTPSNVTIAKFYKGLIKGLVIDKQDAKEAEEILQCGIIPFVTDTLMITEADRIRLAAEVVDFSKSL
jgi:LPPG:FO 2-phospho-L-lactate transferase